MNFTFRKGTIDDVDKFVHFLDQVKAEMTQTDWLYLDPPEVVHSLMENGTMEERSL